MSQRSLWKQTPLGKSTPDQWRYALRISLAMTLSLWLAFKLNLDEPFWAMTSAAVVSAPTIGGVISKSLGRVIGSIIGAFAAVLIAGQCLNDPWLFIFFIAGWMAICNFIAHQQQNNVAYAFSLAGYTTAIIAFSTVNVSDSQLIFDIAQARLCEILTGIICSTLLMIVLPSDSDANTLLTSLRQINQRILEHITLAIQPNNDVRSSYEGLIAKILTMDVLRIQAFWSHYRLRRQNRRVNFLLLKQLRLVSLTSGLRRMLINWPDRPESIDPLLQQLVKELAKPDVTKYQLALILQKIAPTESGDYRHLAFYQRLHHFCWSYMAGQRWLKQIESGRHSASLSTQKNHSLSMHSDSYEAIYSALRTLLCIIVGCAFWLGSHWANGSAALTLAAVCCILYGSTATPVASSITMLKAVAILFIGSFILKFGVMIQISDFWLFGLILTPIIAILQLLKLQTPAKAALYGQLIVFMGSFLHVTNPPTYDYLDFINDGLAKAAGILLAALAFQIMHPFSDDHKSRRLIRAQRRDFIDQLKAKPTLSENQFESLVYHRIGQIAQAKDQQAKLWLLRWSVVLINCSHIVWQLREWQTRSDPLSAVRDVCIRYLKGIVTEKGIQQKKLAAALQELYRMSLALAQHPDKSGRELAGLIWRLYCSLSQLQPSGLAEEPSNTTAISVPTPAQRALNSPQAGDIKPAD
jgi:uncharacterized membrane protein YccC